MRAFICKCGCSLLGWAMHQLVQNRHLCILAISCQTEPHSGRAGPRSAAGAQNPARLHMQVRLQAGCR